MPLVLRIENVGNLGVNIRDSFVLETGSMTIGRGTAADWQLPDVSRVMSTIHCRIFAQDEGYVLTDLSRNGLTVDDTPLERGLSLRLNGGETIVIGPFAIKVGLHPQMPAVPAADGEKTEIARPFQSRTTISHSARQTGDIIDRTIVPRTGNEEPALASTLPKRAVRPAIGRNSFDTSFVMEFASGAQLDPDDLAGLTDAELAYRLGEMMRLIIPALADLSHSMTELRTIIGSETPSTEETGNLFEDTNVNALRALLSMDAIQSRKSVDGLEITLAALKEHDMAVFASMQTALFKLLNTLAPTTIEAEARGKFGSRKARNWDAYGARWEDFTGAGPNGMLDVLLAYFREAYDAKLRGIR